jgi:hypothetical protein
MQWVTVTCEERTEAEKIDAGITAKLKELGYGG